MASSWFCKLVAVPLLVVFVILSGGAAFSADTSIKECPINMSIKDIAIAEVMSMLSEASGVNIVVGQDVKGVVGQVNLRGVTVEQALRMICDSNGLYIRKDAAGYIVSGKPFPTEITTSSTATPTQGSIITPVIAPAIPSITPRIGITGNGPAVPPMVIRIPDTATNSVQTTSKASAILTPALPVSMTEPIVVPSVPVNNVTVPVAIPAVPVSTKASSIATNDARIPDVPKTDVKQSDQTDTNYQRVSEPAVDGELNLETKMVSSRTGGPSVALIPIRYASPAELATMLGGSIAEGRAANAMQFNLGRRSREKSGTRSTNDVFKSMNSSDGSDMYWAQQSGGLGRGLRGGDTSGSNNTGGRNNQGNTGSSNRNSGGNRQGGVGGGYANGMRPDGIDSIIAFMPQNSLLVSGEPAAIDQLREVLALLDQPTKQVEISTKFIQVDVTEEHSFGIDFFVSNGSLEFFQLGFAPGEAINNVVRWAKGTFEATLGVSLSNNKGTVVNEPHITTQNNVPAYISFYTTIPYFTAQITYNSFGQREVDYTEEEIDVEQTLEVTPQINADDTVTMFLAPIMDDQTGTVQGANGEKVPIVATQELETQVTVADGETVVLGGMIRKQKSENYRYTPILSDIPILGSLFTSKTINNQNTELLVFVTPRIVRDIPAQ